MTNGGSLLMRGRTYDPECHRTSHRLQLALRLLAVEGITPTYPEHDPKCIKHPDRSWQRMPGYNYHCECGRGNDPQPTWPEYATPKMFDLAYQLADEFQARRGDWHQDKINEERRAREQKAREERARA